MTATLDPLDTDPDEPSGRTLHPGQRTEVHIADAATGRSRVVFETDAILLEAPNWTLDGQALILNGDGVLWRLDLVGGGLRRIPITGVPAVNNDHVLDPDGEHIFASASDFQIWRAPLAGGHGVRITSPDDFPGLKHFLHGVHPDGRRLAVIGILPEFDGDAWGAADTYTLSATGGDYLALTSGPGPSDGCEYSPDGEWVYLNTEAFDGHAQIGRVRPDGTGLEQLTFDDRVNWFPHLSPDGTRAAYVSFEPGTAGHPADVWVEIRLIDTSDWRSPVTVARVFGGQGAMNVPSWSPDGTAFAFVGYPESEG